MACTSPLSEVNLLQASRAVAAVLEMWVVFGLRSAENCPP